MVIALNFNLAIYSWMLWFVVPAGAMCCGFVAALGYYFGARFFDHRPTKLLLINAVIISTCTFFLIHYLTYSFLRVDGKAVRDLLSFSDFFSWELSHTELHGIGISESAGPLPTSWSAVFAALQIFGFAVGGVAVYALLKALPFCQKCSRYLAPKERQTRYTGDSAQLTQAVIQIRQHVATGRLQEALTIHAGTGDAKSIAGKTSLRSQAIIKRCNGCNRHWIKFTVSRWANREWKDVPEAGFQQFIEPAGEAHPPLPGTD